MEKIIEIKFTKTLSDISVNAGDSANFIAIVDSSDPDFDVQWSKNDENLENSPEYKYTFDENDPNSCGLLIEKCSSKDSGIYKCTVLVADKTATTSASLVVEGEYIIYEIATTMLCYISVLLLRYY